MLSALGTVLKILNSLPNKTLHKMAIPLGSIAAGERRHYPLFFL